MKNNNSEKKFDWKYVLIGTVIIVVIYLVAAWLVHLNNVEKQKEYEQQILLDASIPKTVYCRFEGTANDTIPRNECGILKIISTDLTKIAIDKLEEIGDCGEDYHLLQSCSGETYHFGRYNIQEFVPEVKVDGVVCSAFFITYFNKSILNESIARYISSTEDDNITLLQLRRDINSKFDTNYTFPDFMKEYEKLKYREFYEKAKFTEPNVETGWQILEKLDNCDRNQTITNSSFEG